MGRNHKTIALSVPTAIILSFIVAGIIGLTRQDQRSSATWAEAQLPTGTTAAITRGRATSDFYVDETGVVRATTTDWYELNPFPTANNLRAVDGSSTTDIWAVGDGGSILRWVNGSWEPQGSCLGEDLLDVDVLDSSHVWAVGRKGTILFFDGRSWSRQESGVFSNLEQVTALNANDVIALGEGHTLLQFDGMQWQRMRDDVGRKWRTRTAHASAQDTWLLSFESLAYFDGTTLNEYPLPDCDYTTDFAVVGADRIFVLGGRQNRDSVVFEFDGRFWSRNAVGGKLRAISAYSEHEAWAVGERGVVCRHDGPGSWRKVTAPVTANLTDVYVGAPGTVWIVGERGTLLYYDGRDWYDGRDTELSGDVELVAANGPDDAWLVATETLHPVAYYNFRRTTGQELYHYDGVGFDLHLSPTDARLRDIIGMVQNRPVLGSKGQSYALAYRG
jgi:hypothetical protein